MLKQKQSAGRRIEEESLRSIRRSQAAAQSDRAALAPAAHPASCRVIRPAVVVRRVRAPVEESRGEDCRVEFPAAVRLECPALPVESLEVRLAF